MTHAPASPAPPGPKPGGHIPALDAVRGVAILLVLGYHFAGFGSDLKPTGRALQLLGQGSFGVDLFFVLSGFLISGILFDSRERPRYFRNFYLRRALRIFPLYYGVLFVTFVALPALSAGAVAPYPDTAKIQLWLWLYGTDRYQAWHESYAFTGFNHFWSLAVEEHFYLVWPVVIYLCPRRAGMVVSAICTAAGLGLRTYLAQLGGHSVAVYTLTPCRMDALALGSLLALAVRGPGGAPAVRPWVTAAAALCLPLLLVSYGWKGEDEGLNEVLGALRYSGYAGLFAALLVWAVSVPPGGRAAVLWDNAVLRFFGKYSYGLYVFHYLLLPVYHEWFDGAVSRCVWWTGSATLGHLLFIAAASAASVVVALLSWHLYEKHFLKLKDFLAGPSAAPVAAAPMLAPG